MIIVGSLLLSACNGINLSFGPPAATNVPVAPTALVVPNLTQPQSQSNPPATARNTSEQAPQVQLPPQVLDLQSAFEAVYVAVNPSVVNIQISAIPTAGRSRGLTQSSQPVPVAEGSGFVWDTAGHIATNNHVVAGADKISVTFTDGTTLDAKLVGTDPNSDLAVIQVASLPANVKPIVVADSTQVKVGQMVVAIGNPFGLTGTMTTGIVSAVSRSIQATERTQQSQPGSTPGSPAPSYSIPDIIQTDAAINPGNSGGVLLDLQGSLIGVPSQIESSTQSNSGVGFAIPSAIVKKVVPVLIEKGAFAHSWLGISGTTLTSDLATSLKLNATQRGIVVAEVTPNGPSAKAGLVGGTNAQGNLTGGDVIVAVDGQPLTRFEDLVSYLFNHTDPGQTIKLTVLRNGKQEIVNVVLGTQPAA